MVEPQAFQQCAHAMQRDVEDVADVSCQADRRPVRDRISTPFTSMAFSSFQVRKVSGFALGGPFSGRRIVECSCLQLLLLSRTASLHARVPDNSIFLPQDSADRVLTSRSHTELRVAHVQEFEPASQKLRPVETGGATDPRNPKSIITAETVSIHSPFSVCSAAGDSARMPTPHVSSSLIEDWRKLPANILQSLEYSPHLIAPTGREETFANFSKTVRVFPAAETEAMQVLPCTGSESWSISASSAQQCT